jgi:peptidoglycan/LPS O-acetylase OafA/YrhL
MTKIEKKIYRPLTVYALIVAVASIYHAFNFSHYIQTEGNEIIYYVVLVLIGSVLFQVFIGRQNPAIERKAVLFGTLMVIVASIIFSFLAIMQSDLEGTPTQIILTFGAFNLIFLGLSIVQQVSSLKKQ